MTAAEFAETVRPIGPCCISVMESPNGSNWLITVSDREGGDFDFDTDIQMTDDPRQEAVRRLAAETVGLLRGRGFEVYAGWDAEGRRKWKELSNK